MIAKIAESGKEMSQFVSDFVWYLRDMLLAKNADDTGDIPDMSAENLDRLKDMGEKFSEDTLMYYIRVFSELSGVIRNSASRRIAVEMAVISLAKPALRTDAAALGERVRLLEKKLEEGIIPAAAAEKAVKEPVKEKAKEQETPPGKPAPADLMKIAKEWRTITAKVSLPVVKFYLEHSQPSYDSRDGSADLFLKCENLQARQYLEKEEAMRAVSEAIEAVSGCRVTVHVLEKDGAGNDRISAIPLMDRIRAAVDMPVEIEEE